MRELLAQQHAIRYDMGRQESSDARLSLIADALYEVAIQLATIGNH